MRYSDAELLEEINHVAEELGHQPSLKDFRQYGEVGVTTIYERFGSWNEAIAAAGFEPQDPETKIPREDLIENLQDLAEELGKPPSVPEINEHGDYWASTYRNRFGSWNDALEAAGFEPREKGVAIPKEDLLDELEKLADEIGKAPTYEEMEEKGVYGPRTYIRTFGSWNEAIEAASFESRNIGTEVTDDELLKEIRRLADELDKTPSSRDMDEHGEYWTATYQRHFGSWSAAVDAALEDSDDD